MKTFIVTYRRQYWLEEFTETIDCYNFAEAEQIFQYNQPDDHSIILKIEVKL